MFVNVYTCFAGNTGILLLELLQVQIAILSQEIKSDMRVSLMALPEAVPLLQQ